MVSDGNPLNDLAARIQKSIGRVAVVADDAHSLGASRTYNGKKTYCGAIADFTSFSVTVAIRSNAISSRPLVSPISTIFRIKGEKHLG